MLNPLHRKIPTAAASDNTQGAGIPAPSPQFRRRAWREFQRSLDPLAPPKPLPATRPRRPR